MNRIKTGMAVLLLIVCAFGFAGCSSPDASPEDTKKAMDSQKPKTDAPSLSNPKSADGSGK